MARKVAQVATEARRLFTCTRAGWVAGDGGEGEVRHDAGTKDQAVRRASEPEMAELLALGDLPTGQEVGTDHARGHDRHADARERHQADGGVAGLDKDDRPGGDMCEVGLRALRLDRGRPFGVGPWR